MKVLIADDDKWLRMLLSNRFQKEGFEVETAEDGVEAETTMADFEAEVVVLDLRMPHQSGMETIDALRRKGYKGFAIGLSALLDDELRAEGIRFGFNVVVDKQKAMELPTHLRQMMSLPGPDPAPN